MAQRYCSICHADVEDVGGFCLLGHSLKLAPETASFGELRQEVDRSFEEARAKLAALVNGDDEPPPPPPAQSHRSAPVRYVTPSRPAAAPPPARVHTPVPAPSPVHTPVPSQAPPVPARVHTPVPSNGSEEQPGDSVSRLWRALQENQTPVSEDPISAFAPPPRMDWGPSRFKRSRRDK
ncbi:MAG TPA: hypothetical protein VHJ82_06350 [Actinomycetota bacterium]|nr:hypothetical protein [Actinomycetota bacterium]